QCTGRPPGLPGPPGRDGFGPPAVPSAAARPEATGDGGGVSERHPAASMDARPRAARDRAERDTAGTYGEISRRQWERAPRRPFLRRGFRGSGARWRGFPLRARTSRGATAYACASMLGRQAILEAATSYLRSHPEELGRVLRNALGLRFGVPIAGLRWLAGQGGSGPQDVEIDADPPGIRLAATLDMMGVPVRATTSIFIERIRASAGGP